MFSVRGLCIVEIIVYILLFYFLFIILYIKPKYRVFKECKGIYTHCKGVNDIN